MMPSDQFDAIAQLMRSPPGPARDACKLVLADGLRPSDAARQAGSSPASVSNAVKRVRDAMTLAKQAAGADPL